MGENARESCPERTLETSPHTSVRRRVRHAKAKGRLAELKAAESGSVAASRVAGKVEQYLWLCPIEDRRRQGSTREGMVERFSLGSYLLRVDYTSLIRTATEGPPKTRLA